MSCSVAYQFDQERVARPEVLRRACFKRRQARHALRSTSGRATQSQTLPAIRPPRLWEKLRWLFAATLAFAISGCGGSSGGHPDLVWGQRGLRPGEFLRPRAIAVDLRQDLLYIVDFAGRIQVFDRDGNYLRGWSTPTIVKGRPAGIAIGNDGNILVADSHYARILIYSPEGKLLREITGAAGEGPGEFAYVSDVVQDEHGYFYITEYGEEDRVRKLSPEGRYVKHWGSHGNEPGQLVR